MRFLKKKIAGVMFSLMLVASLFSSVYADTSLENTTNNVLSSENTTVENTNDIDVESFKVELGVGNITEDGQLEVSNNDEYSTEDKLDERYSKTSLLSSLYGEDRIKTAVKVSQKGWSTADTVVIVNSKSTMLGIVATPLATSYNAPILITGANSLDSAVSNELSRLKPSNVIIIGDRSLVSKVVSDKIKSITGANIERIFGSSNQELSVAVANKISTLKSVDTAYIVSGYNGVADALTISSKAGSTKNPVIVVDKNSIGSTAYSYLKQNVSTVYYIGGTNSISNTLVSKISGVVKNAGNINRISGNDRHDTNIKVINRFYKNSNLGALVVTKSDNQGLIDTVCAGPFAALYDAPIMLTSKTTVPLVTKTFLNGIVVSNIFQIGGGISSSVSSEIRQRASSKISSNTNINNNSNTSPNTKNINNGNSGNSNNQIPNIINGNIKGKTIVIDPGHGGRDSGARGLYNNLEKEWTLITAMACANYLKSAGANVIMTRTTDTYPTLQDRATLSNQSNAVLFCSIHYNKGGDIINEETGEMSGNGVEVFKGEGSEANTVAKNVLNSILSGFNLKNRGVKDGTHLYVIANTEAPAILVEGGFMSSTKDVRILNSEAALKKMGVQIAKGIIASFK